MNIIPEEDKYYIWKSSIPPVWGIWFYTQEKFHFVMDEKGNTRKDSGFIHEMNNTGWTELTLEERAKLV